MQKLKDWRLILTIFGTLALLAMACVVLVIWQKERGLAELKAELTAKGERLDWALVITNPPAHLPNGWSDLLAAAKALPDMPRALQLRLYSAPGHRIPIHELEVLPMNFHWRRTSKSMPPSVQVVSNIWDELEASIEANRHLWQSVRLALTNDLVHSRLDWSQGYALRLSHLAPMKNLSTWNHYAVQLDLQRGELTGAVDMVVDGFRLIGKYAEEPCIISQLVRLIHFNTTADAVWLILQHPRLAAKQLKALQDAVTNISLAPEFLQGMEMERAMVIHLWKEAVEKGNVDWGMFGQMSSRGPERIFQRVLFNVWRGSIAAHDLGYYLRQVQPGLELMRESVTARSLTEYDSRISPITRPSRNSPLFLSQSVLNDWSDSFRKLVQAQIHRALLITAIGLRRFQHERGRLPDQLTDLVPEVLAEVPTDWMDGKALRYKRLTDHEFHLWSVGSNGIDDGGDPTPPAGEDYTWLNGNDIIWPQRATADAINTFTTNQVHEWRSRIGMQTNAPALPAP